MALKQLKQAAVCSSSGRSAVARPLPRRAAGAGSSSLRGRSSGSSLLVARAAAEGSSAAGAPPVLTWPRDTETARDVFSFAGPLPERLNGRLAMIGFLGIVLEELKSGTPAAEQFAGDAAGVSLLVLSLLLGSLFPKFVSGTSLAELHASATSDNLKGEGALAQALALFDQGLELWTGRLAMVGIAGLLVTEGVTGKVLF